MPSGRQKNKNKSKSKGQQNAANDAVSDYSVQQNSDSQSEPKIIDKPNNQILEVKNIDTMYLYELERKTNDYKYIFQNYEKTTNYVSVCGKKHPNSDEFVFERECYFKHENCSEWYFKIQNCLIFHLDYSNVNEFVSKNLNHYGYYMYISNKTYLKHTTFDTHFDGSLEIILRFKFYKKSEQIKVLQSEPISDVMPSFSPIGPNILLIARIYYVCDLSSCGIESGRCHPNDNVVWHNKGGVENVSFSKENVDHYSPQRLNSKFCLSYYFGIYVEKNASLVVVSDCNRCNTKWSYKDTVNEHHTRTLFTNGTYIACEGELVFRFAQNLNICYSKRNLIECGIIDKEFIKDETNCVYFLSEIPREKNRQFSVERVWVLNQLTEKHKKEFGFKADWCLTISEDSSFEAIMDYETGFKEVKYRQFGDANTHQLWQNYIENPNYQIKPMDNIKIINKISLNFNDKLLNIEKNKQIIDYNKKPTENIITSDLVPAFGEQVFGIQILSHIYTVVSVGQELVAINKLNDDVLKLLNFSKKLNPNYYKDKPMAQLTPFGELKKPVECTDNAIEVPNSFKIGDKLIKLLLKDKVEYAFINKVCYKIDYSENIFISLMSKNETPDYWDKSWLHFRPNNHGLFDLFVYEYEDQSSNLVSHKAAIFVVFYAEQTK